jgi:nicotinate-nucleotide adenylyltransferase
MLKKKERHMSKIPLAVYGGAFNPPHPGHAQVMKGLLEKAEKVLVVPSYAHPFGKHMVAFETRVGWLNKIVTQLQDERILVDACEEDLAAIKTPIFSIDLLRFIADRFGLDSKSVALVMGADNAKVFPTFYGYQAIVDEFSVITMPEVYAIHSTMLRSTLVRAGEIPQDWIAPGLTQQDYQVYSLDPAGQANLNSRKIA